jgi:hypothetical protein
LMAVSSSRRALFSSAKTFGFPFIGVRVCQKWVDKYKGDCESGAVSVFGKTCRV